MKKLLIFLILFLVFILGCPNPESAEINEPPIEYATVRIENWSVYPATIYFDGILKVTLPVLYYYEMYNVPCGEHTLYAENTGAGVTWGPQIFNLPITGYIWKLY